MSDTKLPEGFDWRRITPEDSPRTPEDLFEDLNYLNLSKADLSVGDPAFLFSGEVYDFSSGRKESTGERFDLETRFQHKPVALILVPIPDRLFGPRWGPLTALRRLFRSKWTSMSSTSARSTPRMVGRCERTSRKVCSSRSTVVFPNASRWGRRVCKRLGFGPSRWSMRWSS